MRLVGVAGQSAGQLRTILTLRCAAACGDYSLKTMDLIGSASLSRATHNPELEGSNPSPANLIHTFEEHSPFELAAHSWLRRLGSESLILITLVRELPDGFVSAPGTPAPTPRDLGGSKVYSSGNESCRGAGFSSKELSFRHQSFQCRV
jgi:hypothetical protein